ncbi:MAG: pyridoxamine 5'-phosphate oxidase family protein [Lawsonibacter sp.]|nr:pyridoxamine 5'-phosphate oxidase family protein [Lawsonibacter sp.]
MIQAMRRKRQELSQEDTAAILERGTSGVLALAAEGSFPYAVPLSYVYTGKAIYFHCAKSGYKLELIAQNPKASFCVIDQDQIVPEEYTTYFRSVIVFGLLRVMEDGPAKRAAIEKLAAKYYPEGSAAGRQAAIDKEWNILCVLELSISHMTGKEAIELVKGRQG